METFFNSSSKKNGKGRGKVRKKTMKNYEALLDDTGERNLYISDLNNDKKKARAGDLWDLPGYRERKLYICAQAPLKNTVCDFWRMIWQQGVSVIVMLTGLEENGENEEVCQREVLHFHFLMWSDFLSPGQPSWLLRFIKRVNEHYTGDRGPLLVHCSEGVGRTGTYVAIDSLIEQLDAEGIVDIFSFVTHLRYHRNHLIRTLEEYMFVYRALMEHAQFGDTELELHHLRDHYELLKGKVRDNCRTGLEVEFEKLNDVFEEPKTYCVGAWDINRCKNRYECIIPYDMNRVILLPSIADQSSYINASHIQNLVGLMNHGGGSVPAWGCKSASELVDFSQRPNSPRLIEDETLNDCGIINNLIDYVDGQEEAYYFRADRICAGIQLSNKLGKRFLKMDTNSERNMKFQKELRSYLVIVSVTSDKTTVVAKTYLLLYGAKK
ncbi:tyrosine-protein phosphatase 69D [Trichonephila clavipes]|nr:tyrosine-protein phosphatase 69D [Trichonephila clavipes]